MFLKSISGANGKKVRMRWPSGKAIALHSKRRGFDPGGRNQKYYNSRFHLDWPKVAGSSPPDKKCCILVFLKPISTHKSIINSPTPVKSDPVRSGKLSNVETVRFDSTRAKILIFKKILLQIMEQKIFAPLFVKEFFELQKFYTSGDRTCGPNLFKGIRTLDL